MGLILVGLSGLVVTTCFENNKPAGITIIFMSAAGYLMGLLEGRRIYKKDKK